MSKLHPLARSAFEVLQNQENLFGSDIAAKRRILDICVSKSQLDRALRVFSELIEAMELRGYEVAIEKKTVVKIRTTVTAICIRENWKSNSSGAVGKPGLEDRLIPGHFSKAVGTGRLIFNIDGGGASHNGIKRSWKDGKRQLLGDCVADILVCLEKTAASKLDFMAAEVLRRLESDRLSRIERERTYYKNRIQTLVERMQNHQRLLSMTERLAESLKVDLPQPIREKREHLLEWAIHFAKDADPFKE